LRSLKIRF